MPSPAGAKLAVVAPSEIYPRNAREKELCDAASRPDWLYTGGSVAFLLGSVYFDANVANESTSPVVRVVGPAAMGLSWGVFLGGIFPTLPKCSLTWVPNEPLEGSPRSRTYLAVSFAALAALSAPLLIGSEQSLMASVSSGDKDKGRPEVSGEERRTQMFLGAGLGALGALIPYVLPPRPLRAIRALEQLRAEPYNTGFRLSYELRF